MDVASPAALVGTWQVHRRLRDSAVGHTGAMTGTMALTPHGADIDWFEQGVLTWLGREVAVSRRYRLRDTTDGWWLLFEDGRPFHSWTPGVPVEHPCAADLYRGLISLDGPGSWRMLWDVRGPTKQQRILTRFSRVADPALIPLRPAARFRAVLAHVPQVGDDARRHGSA